MAGKKKAGRPKKKAGRKKNPGRKKNATIKSKSANVSIPVSKLVNSALETGRKKNAKKRGKRRRNPGFGGINRDAVKSMAKLGGGAILGIIFGAKWLDKIQIAGIGKGIIQVIAAGAARRFIPDKDVSMGAQAVLFANALKTVLESQGITALSGDGLTDTDMKAIEAALVGEALPGGDRDFLGEAISRPGNTFGETLNPNQVIDMNMGEAADYEEVSL